MQLCDRDTAQLVVVDVQSRLAAAMAEDDRQRVLRNSAILVQAAGLLHIPLTVSEQYPQGLGPTEEVLAWHLPAGLEVVEKQCFACTGAERFRKTLTDHHRPQVVLTGMESHVCILQTALTLLAEGYAVFVAEDGICARHRHHHENAIARLRQAGVVVSNTESIVFEWLRDARHEHFKTLSALVK